MKQSTSPKYNKKYESKKLTFCLQWKIVVNRIISYQLTLTWKIQCTNTASRGHPRPNIYRETRINPMFCFLLFFCNCIRIYNQCLRTCRCNTYIHCTTLRWWCGQTSIYIILFNLNLWRIKQIWVYSLFSFNKQLQSATSSLGRLSDRVVVVVFCDIPLNSSLKFLW